MGRVGIRAKIYKKVVMYFSGLIHKRRREYLNLNMNSREM